MAKMRRTTYQLRKQKGLTRLGGADSQGSTKLQSDIGQRAANSQDNALVDTSPDVMKLAPGGKQSRHFADYAHGGKKLGAGGKENMLQGTVAGGLLSRQFKGQI